MKKGGRRTVNLFFRLLMKRSETSWLLENINEQSLYCSLSIYHSLFLYLVLSDCLSPSLTLSLSLFCLPVFSLFIFTFINIALIMNPLFHFFSVTIYLILCVMYNCCGIVCMPLPHKNNNKTISHVPSCKNSWLLYVAMVIS